MIHGSMTPPVSLYTRFISGLVFPLHERFKRHDSVRLRRELEQSQYWPRAALERFQLERLKALLTHAGSHVPYYRDWFRRLGFEPGAVASADALRCLPLLDKAAIRANLQGLKSERAAGLSRYNTGGSSGEPLIFFIGPERVSCDVAAKWRATRWWGVDIGDPEIVLWGSPIELETQDRLRGFRDRLLRTKLLPAFEMSAERLAHFVAEIRRIRPRMMFGYPSALAHLAQYAQERGIALNDLGIAVAFVTAERLYDHQREIIQRSFGCPVANGYGGRDAGFIAHECPAGGMHVTCEDVLVEIVDERGQSVPMGQAGEIVVTHLGTRDFPFIRYRTGDVGVLSDATCRCGRTLPLMQEIQGRSTDFVVARDGTVLHGLALIYILRDLPGIKHFRIEQESLDLVRIRLVGETGANPVVLTPQIVNGVKARLGSEVDVRVEWVSTIPTETSGKYRYVLSRVDPRWANGGIPRASTARPTESSGSRQ
jgi:phenylacetate-CoA ligase